jgi:hypothetical protein
MWRSQSPSCFACLAKDAGICALFLCGTPLSDAFIPAVGLSVPAMGSANVEEWYILVDLALKPAYLTAAALAGRNVLALPHSSEVSTRHVYQCPGAIPEEVNHVSPPWGQLM